MNLLDAALLGIIQGITEFLPVSSSGHLKLAEYFLGYRDLDQYLPFDVVCHFGTLLAIFVVFHPSIRNALRNRTRLAQLTLGTLPLFPCVLLLKQIKSVFNQPQLLGIFFMATSLLLFLAMRFGWEKSEEERENSRWRDPLFIGLFQALALFPGISRSGSTIAGARLFGWQPKDAIEFSFLLAIPAIAGAMALETAQLVLGSGSAASIPLSAYAAGFLTSFLTGILSLRILIKLAMKNRFMYFVGYTLILGIAVTFYFNT